MKKQLAALLITSAVTLSFSTALVPGVAEAASAKIVSSVNFRSAPNVDSSTYGYLKKGETVEILSEVNSYWYKVKSSSGKIGYISTSSQYVKTSSSSGGSGSSGSSGNTSGTISKVISAGKKYMGTPYEFGSDRSNTRTFDCSDFVRQAFKEGAGVTLPSDSRGQASYVKAKGNTTTNWRNLKAGDLMFFMGYEGTKASNYPSNKSGQRVEHVGIYLGNGQILHTYSKDSGGVRIDSIAGKHWEYRFIFGGSAL